MKIPYSQYPGITSRIVLAPIVSVTLRYAGNELPGFALVDSGAMRGVISTVVAEALGIPWDTIPATQGFSVGGTIRSHFIEHVQAELYGHQFMLGLSIVEGLAPYQIILGQADIFHHAKITFEEYKKQYEIEFRKMN